MATKETLKQGAQQASDKLDQASDTLMGKAVKSKYSWVFLLVVFGAGYLAGWYIHGNGFF